MRVLRTEREYILEMKKGSPQAFEALYELYHRKLYNFIFRISNGNTSICEDIVQSVFIKLWEVRETVDEEKRLLNFLCTAAKNKMLNTYSHQTVRYIYQAYVLKHASELENTTEQEVDRNMLEELIDEWTESLPPARKKIFILSRKEGKSNKEIAQIMGITESTIETQLGKATGFLKDKVRLYYKITLLLAAMLTFFNLR